MQCATCGTELLFGKKFCHACGAQAVVTCPSCGATVEPEFRFCPDCGTRLTPESADGAPPAQAGSREAAFDTAVSNDHVGRLPTLIPPELATRMLDGRGGIVGERKLVTVLFCDLVGSTAIAERMDPEEYRDVLGEYLAVAFREIHKIEGIVNQVAGDGVMALFGAPVAREDAPQRAVRAGLAILAALERLSQRLRAERGFELRARCGINTGPVVVGAVGNDLKLDYTATGDTTNLAARLQALAEPGTIVVSETTYRRVRGFFELQPMGRFEVKGKSEPVAAYRVMGIGETTTPMELAAARGMTPLVGREGELGQLHACYQRLAAHLAQVVAVVGEAGSGKSRLLYEFREQLEGEDIVVLEARCSSLSQTLPYAPWTAMMRQFFDLTSGEPVAAASEKIAQRLKGLSADLSELHPHMCRLLSIPLEGDVEEVSVDQAKREIFESMARLVGGLAKRTPVLMIIEDLHWIDDSSREMLELAAARLHGPIMLIISHRPDYLPFWRTEAAFTQLRLRPLSDEDTTRVIRAVAGGALAAELEHRIGVKAEGNPFFAEEITRALIEEGHVVRDNGDVRLARPLDQIRLPGTVEEVIAARVDRFGPGPKRVSQVAAVLGRQFRRAHLVALLHDEQVDVTAALADLERRGVIHRKTVLSADDEYRFGESLTQEVAYESLLLKDRRQLHERIGHLLEAEADDRSVEKPALLAHHFARSDNREKAVAALLQAAKRAEELPSYGAAARFYREAWTLAAAQLDETPQPERHLTEMALTAGVGLSRMAVIYAWADAAETEEVVRRARELAIALEDHQNVAGLWTYHGMLIVNSGRERFAEGVTLLERGLEAAHAAHLGSTISKVSRGLAWAYMYDGRFDLALDIFRAVVHEMEISNERAHLSDVYLGSRFMRDQAAYYSDDLTGALEKTTETYEMAVRRSNRTVQSSAAAIIAMVHYAHGAYADARQWADRSLAVAETIENIGALRSAAVVALSARTALGEAVVGAGYFDLIEQGFIGRGDMALKSISVADVLLELGEIQRAQGFVELAYGHAGGRFREAMCTVAMADVLRHRGADHWDEAAQWYARALTLAQPLTLQSTLAAAHLGAAELAADRGDRAVAAQHLQNVLAACQAIGLRRYQPRIDRLQVTLNTGAAQRA